MVAVAVVSAACSNDSNSTVTPPTSTTDILSGTLNAPVNGLAQTAISPFTVGQSGGTVQVTLTSAVETLPGGTLLPTVTVGLAVGTFSGGACSVISTSFTPASGGSNPQISGSLTAGNYCVIVSDIIGLAGPVSYALAVTHP